MTADLAVAALRNVAALREPVGTTLHSDRISQLQSRKFVEDLKEFGITGSMGRVGA
jgi:putative transposase